jgi:hypothetical protein
MAAKYSIILAVLLSGCGSPRATHNVDPATEPINFVVLSSDAFQSEHHKAFDKQDLKNETDRERFRSQVFSVQGAIDEALKSRWKEDDDYAVAWDFNYCFHTCGGIYSDRVFCEDYVRTIREALRSVDPEGVWTYHTVCEIIVNPNGKTAGEMTEDRGEFFVRSGVCYIDGATMKPEWRARLGCKE